MGISHKSKAYISSIFNHLGYEIKRKPIRTNAKKATSSRREELTHFESCLHLLMGTFDTINVVQIGANDGATNDPLHAFLKTHPNRSRVILVEPQSYLIPYLEENYRFHKDCYIFNGAIGPNRSLKLHRIRKEFWGELEVPYASTWPAYRAPTGITSSNYEHVSAWASHFYKGSSPVSDLIETVEVESINVSELLRRSGKFDKVDVLQIDTEGFDDEVIYASNIEKFRPFIINFELAHLDMGRATALEDFLNEQHYILSPHGLDGLAIRSHP
jgi:FkbM family methyltransferase